MRLFQLLDTALGQLYFRFNFGQSNCQYDEYHEVLWNEFWSFLANLSFIGSFMSLTEHWAHSHSTPWFDVMVKPFASISFDCFVIAIIRTKRFNPIFSFFGIVELGD